MDNHLIKYLQIFDLMAPGGAEKKYVNRIRKYAAAAPGSGMSYDENSSICINAGKNYNLKPVTAKIFGLHFKYSFN